MSPPAWPAPPSRVRLGFVIRKHSWSMVVSLATLSFLAACGASMSDSLKLTALTPEEEAVFEHGVDFVATPEGLEGKWREDWERDLDVRARAADVVAIVDIHTIKTDVDPEQRTTHRLVGKIERLMGGEAQADEVEMSVREGVPGYLSVRNNLARLQGAKMVAYLRWFRTDLGTIAPHWHLSPAEPGVIEATQGALSRYRDVRGEDGKRVIVHTHEN